MKICIVGAGATGGYLGAKLINAGLDVSLVARGAHLEAMKKKGLTIIENEKEITCKPKCSDSMEELGKMDFIFITLKTYSIPGVVKEIINKGGEKISPLEIDDAIMKHESVFQGITFPIVHNKLGEEVAAAVVLKDDHQLTEQVLKEFLGNILASYKIPQTIVFLDEIPKGKTGKLQRIGLAKKLGLEK